MRENSMDDRQVKVEILGEYWRKWREWMEEVRNQRYEAMRVLQYQNELQERRLKQIFRQWQQVLLQEKISNLNKLRESMIEDKNDCDEQISLTDDKDQQIFKVGLAIKYHQKKTYSKCIRSWIHYGITTKRFQNQLSIFYIRFLLKKYFHVINHYRLHSKNKKIKKVQTLSDHSAKLGQLRQFSQSKIDPYRTVQNITQIQTQLSMANQMPKNVGDNQNVTDQMQFQQTRQTNTLMNFKRNYFMGQSRRSQFSNLSANINYQSIRKFRPIMELPSIPDIQSFPKTQTEINKQQTQICNQKDPMRFYESRDQSQAGPYNFNRAPNLAESKVSQIREENPLKQKLLQILLKEKLISLAIMSGEQFKEGMQYENYRQRTICSLRKIRQLKIV